ncbi:MAG: TolC family protein [Acidobacteriia bacterium]|nr:TolC family protein [Terriglobia bacterium]
MRTHPYTVKNSLGRCAAIVLALGAGASPGMAQNRGASGLAALVQPQTAEGAARPAAPATLTLQDALARAQQNEPSFLAAVNGARLAHEDSLQARAALLPSAGLRSDFLNTQGNGVFPSGRYVSNDGVHLYREWGVAHQDLSAGTLTKSGYHRATAAEAVAQAKAEIARRGLALTVTRTYYGLVIAQRKYATAQLALTQAQQFVTITQELERGGEAPHSDTIKAQLQSNAQDQTLRDARLGMENARLDLTVLLSSTFDENFQVVDDLHLAAALPAYADVQAMARRENPDLRAALETVRGAGLEVTLAHQAFLPTLTVDMDYGLEANQLGWNTVVAGDPARGKVPSVGYFLTASLNLPVWDWGARKSRLRQAEVRREQATVELNAAQRQLLRNLTGFYQEAQTAREEADLLRQSSDLAGENLRLNTLRYQAGEATILELVDAQNTLTQARNALDDGLARYRVALAELQTVTGGF